MSSLHGVVVCPRCHSAKGCRIGQKTTTCRCGNVINLKGTQFHFKTSNLRELAKSVAAMNAKLSGGRTEFGSADFQSRRGRGVHGRVARIAAKASSREDMFTVVVTRLTEELGTFSKKDFTKVMGLLGVSNVQRSIDVLVESNIIYETEPGRYKSV